MIWVTCRVEIFECFKQVISFLLRGEATSIGPAVVCHSLEFCIEFNFSSQSVLSKYCKEHQCSFFLKQARFHDLL